MTLVALGGKFESVGPRVDTKVRFAPGNNFWRACGKALRRTEFQQLIAQGFCYHKFPNQRDLLFTFRSQAISERYIQANLDVIDPANRKVMGVRDFEIMGTDKARMYALVVMPQAGFNSEARDALLRIGFSEGETQPAKFIARRWPPGQVAFFIAEGYRQRDKRGYDGLAQILMGTAVRIIAGLGTKRIILAEVGEYNVSRDKLMAYYARQFGATMVNELMGDMAIELATVPASI